MICLMISVKLENLFALSNVLVCVGKRDAVMDKLLLLFAGRVPAFGFGFQV